MSKWSEKSGFFVLSRVSVCGTEKINFFLGPNRRTFLALLGSLLAFNDDLTWSRMLIVIGVGFKSG